MKKRMLFCATIIGFSLLAFQATAFNVDNSNNVELLSNIEDIIGPRPPHIEIDKDPIPMPKPEELASNESYKKYDPYYPTKDRYGDYILTIPSLKERVSFKTSETKALVGTIFAPGVGEDKGYKDATKRWESIDPSLCFAAASSNLLSWYLERYTMLNPADSYPYEKDVEKIFDCFRRGWDPLVGGNPVEALSWYFTGGFPSGSKDPYGSTLTGAEQGGYLKNRIPSNKSRRWSEVSLRWDPAEAFSVYGGYEDDDSFPYIEEVGGIYNGAFSTYEGFSEQIIRQLHYGPSVISVLRDRVGQNSGHAITLWGADYDVKTGLVTKIYLTDSDDVGRGLFAVDIERGPENGDGGVKMKNYSYNPPTGASEKFTRIRNSIVLYAPDVVKKAVDIGSISVASDSNILIDSSSTQRIKLKATANNGEELSYLPKLSLAVKDSRGRPVNNDKIKLYIDSSSLEIIIEVLDNNIASGEYIIEMTDSNNNVHSISLSFSKHLEPIKYTISFHSSSSLSPVVEEYIVNEPKALISNPFTKTGFKFKGWSREENGNAEFKDMEIVDSLLKQEGNLNLYAVWEEISYRIVYHSMGGMGVMPDQTITYDRKERLLKNSLVKEGYEFKGWSREENGNVAFLDEDYVLNLASTEAEVINLYAVWEPIELKPTIPTEPIEPSEPSKPSEGGSPLVPLEPSINNDNRNSLSGGAIALISISSILGIVIILGGVIIFMKKR